MNTWISILPMLLFTAYSCNPGANEAKQKDSTHAAVQNQPPAAAKPVTDTLDCPQLISLLFESSSFSVEGLDKGRLRAYVNQVEDSNVLIRVLLKEESTNGTLGWLKLNLKNNTLSDITNDLEDPQPVTFDTRVLDRLLKNCRFENE